MLDQRELRWFAAMNATLYDLLDAAALRENVELLQGLATTIVERAVADGGEALHGDMRDLARVPAAIVVRRGLSSWGRSQAMPHSHWQKPN